MQYRGLVAFAAICLSSASFANPYFGAGIGKVDYDLGYFDDPTGIQLFIGNRINQNIAIEAGYIDFGDSEDGIPPVWTLSAKSFRFGGKFIAPLAGGADIFIQGGLHFWDAEVTEDGFGTISEDDGSDLYYGFGGKFGLTPNLGLGLEYTIYNLDEVEVSYFGANLEFGF